ncbi:hypothetical protein [Shinella zoogloeoides]|uniref:hypothetical protein n=1 Tax=Shinella zoogloeoides TaxID=352475 RepID=UPI00299DF30C|nr:hypothetical protein [Shinella zoogloeoides]
MTNDHYILQILKEIKAAYEADGKGAVYKRMGEDSGIDPNNFSKWLSEGKRRRDNPHISNAPAIFALYTKATGKPLDFPVITKDQDPSIRRVIAAMDKLDSTQRENIANLVEAYAKVNPPTPGAGT